MMRLSFGLYILDDTKRPVRVEDAREWGEWLKSHPELHHVGDDEVGTIRVSTIFTASSLDPDPSLFETMVFGGSLDLAQVRYKTWAEAEAGHKGMLALVLAKDGA